ncbi:hypothetical protein FWF74_03295 [Candidatus Saccharibacteria bacterium]|nr:hypothetical protein [Candidatus Saccharibacteria bacterium]MCL1962798.1 hypothetical protein [Candidatus Saccharibacteria bacterium]
MMLGSRGSSLIQAIFPDRRILPNSPIIRANPNLILARIIFRVFAKRKTPTVQHFTTTTKNSKPISTARAKREIVYWTPKEKK